MTATDDNLKFAIELEADRMVNSPVEKKLLDTEMTVVRNEFEMRREHRPTASCCNACWKPPTRGTTTAICRIGNRSDIENVPINRLAAFYQKYLPAR